MLQMAGLPFRWSITPAGYDSVATLGLLEGVVDIYMPDAKFGDEATARRLAGTPDYPARMKEAIREMHRQVGDLRVDADGIAERGLLVRHLVLPVGHAGSREIFRFLAREVSPDTYVNVMEQYRPEWKACQRMMLPNSAGESQKKNTKTRS